MLNVRSCAAIALVCVAGFGCKKASGSEHRAGSGSAAASGPDLGLYVHCFNEVEPRVRASWDSYAKWVDPKTGLTGKEKSIDGIDPIDDYHTGKCLENLAAALANGGGSGPLAEPTRTYQVALNKLLPLVLATKAYYDHKDYKDDAFAKGKALHGELTAAFADWDKANVAMRTTWEAQHRAARDKDLADTERKLGRKSEQFVSALVMNTGEELIEVVTGPDDPAALKAAIEKYQAAFAEMDAFYGPSLAASNDTDRYMFKQSSDALLVQTKEAARAMAAGKPLPAEGDGSRSKLLDAYNALVTTSNDITWD